MFGKTLFLAILIGLLTSHTTARALQRSPMESQELLHPHPTGMHPDAYDNFVKSCLSDKESSNATTPKQGNVYTKTVASASGPSYNAFAYDINACLFSGWTTSPRVLNGPVHCNGGSLTQLCYGLNPPIAQFAVCYDTTKLIPIFTGHVLKYFTPSPTTSMKPANWRENKAKGALFPANQELSTDYDASDQIRVHGSSGWSQPKEYFCSRGHLTPKGDFPTGAERKLTFVVTNAAPQWQKFNNKNWAAVENAVRRYSSSKRRSVYIFTGTGGEILVSSGGTLKLKNRVTAPQWYWKAVCDPSVMESIVFVAENNIHDMTTAKRTGCNGLPQTSEHGVVFCFGLEEAKAKHKDFQLPPFEKTSCGTNRIGRFLDPFIATHVTK